MQLHDRKIPPRSDQPETVNCLITDNMELMSSLVFPQKLEKQTKVGNMHKVSSIVSSSRLYTTRLQLGLRWSKLKRAISHLEVWRQSIDSPTSTSGRSLRLSFLVLPTVWSTATIATILITIFFLYNINSSEIPSPGRYSLFSAKPFVLGSMTSKTGSDDSRATKLNKVFEDFNCPLKGTGEIFVREADINGIPYWLVPAISFQESSCGKKTPEKDGKESYNAYGWGVWGEHIKFFDSWEGGIATVSRYIGDTFYSKGVVDVCVIMSTYTPPSNGSWCLGVEYFGDYIQNYVSKE